MKKVLKFIVILTFVISIITSWLIVFQKTALAYEPPGELRWATMTCHDGSSYEICFYCGTGSSCSPWGKQIGCP